MTLRKNKKHDEKGEDERLGAGETHPHMNDYKYNIVYVISNHKSNKSF